jgi:PTH1 family peptidyl-tRNA hydrolase
VGLGNPGAAYTAHRHNLGFRVVATVAARARVVLDQSLCGALTGALGETLLVLPQTFMNRCGYAVRCLVERSGVSSRDILVVYDDVALPLGRMRARPGGGAGGHRGMESVLENLQTGEVPRLRLGVAPATGIRPGDDLAPFVLAPFEESEQGAVAELVERGADAIELWLREGIEAVMNRCNAEAVADPDRLA